MVGLVKETQSRTPRKGFEFQKVELSANYGRWLCWNTGIDPTSVGNSVAFILIAGTEDSSRAPVLYSRRARRELPSWIGRKTAATARRVVVHGVSTSLVLFPYYFENLMWPSANLVIPG